MKRDRHVEVPTVLVVDDDVSQRGATVRLLKAMGFLARGFASAEELLSSPHLNEACCLIVDVAMPGMSGLDLQERLIAQGRLVPMVFITAFSDERVRSQAMKHGAIGFLTKPFDESVLLECVNEALKRRSDTDEA